MSGISIFMYHQVGRFAQMKQHRTNYCDVGRFRQQMRALRRLGVPVLAMSEAVAALRGERPLPRRAVVLTFDDGCENFHEHALPILAEFGLPAIVYPIAGMVGGQGEWLAAVGHPVPPLMSFAQLREVAAHGIEIGSHALHHVRLATLPPQEQLAELRDSRARLQDELGRDVRHLCYPYGSHSLDTLRAAAEAGYVSGVTTQRGAATPAFDLLALPRKAVSFGDDLIGYLWKLYVKNRFKGQALRCDMTGAAADPQRAA